MDILFPFVSNLWAWKNALQETTAPLIASKSSVDVFWDSLNGHSTYYNCWISKKANMQLMLKDMLF